MKRQQRVRVVPPKEPLAVTPKMAADFRRNMAKLVRNGIPLKGNKCRNKCKGGRVVRQVSGLFLGRLTYHTPACTACGREYPYAKEDEVPTAGELRFYKIMTTPFTI